MVQEKNVFHPGNLPGIHNDVTNKFRKEVWLMALPSFGTHEAGTDLTGQSPAQAGGNDGAKQPLEPITESEDTSGADWRSDASGFYD